ncbi:hypothetical protein RhiirB3_481036 [Rhizophagus irregularis]|nr:hypothetical protein RhiirB3_481036 [Rhizophagus irregularis]
MSGLQSTVPPSFPPVSPVPVNTNNLILPYNYPLNEDSTDYLQSWDSESDDIRTSLNTEPSKRKPSSHLKTRSPHNDDVIYPINYSQITDPKSSLRSLYPKSDDIKPRRISLSTMLSKLKTSSLLKTRSPHNEDVIYPVDYSQITDPKSTSFSNQNLETQYSYLNDDVIYSDDDFDDFQITDPKSSLRSPYPKSDDIKPRRTPLYTVPPKRFADPKIISSRPLYPKSDDIKPRRISLSTMLSKLKTPSLLNLKTRSPHNDDVIYPVQITDPKSSIRSPYPESVDIKPRRSSDDLRSWDSEFDDISSYNPYSDSGSYDICTSFSNQNLKTQYSHLNDDVIYSDDDFDDFQITDPKSSLRSLYPESEKPRPIYSTPKILPTYLNLRSSQSSHHNIPNNNDSKNYLIINPKSQLETVSFDQQSSHQKIPIVKSLPSWQSPSIPKLITNNQQVIQQLKLTHGLFLNGDNIQPSKQATVTEKGKLDMSLYNGQPIVYTNINDPVLSVNLLNFNSDENNFIINTLQPSDLCINFPMVEVTYNSDLSESFSKYTNNDEKLYKLYGHIFARKTLIGGKLFIKELNLATLTQIDLFKFYIFWTYNSAKHNIENPINDLPISYLPRINTLDGLLLDTPEKISNWFKDLYQNNVFDIISYKNLIPVTQFKNNPLTEENFEEKQPGVANFKEELSLKEWVGNVKYINLVRWIKDFHFLQGIIITKFYKMEISKKNAASFIKLPIVKSSNKSYLEIIRPTKKVEEFLINNNIFSIKDVSSFPFISIIQPNDSNYGDYNFLVKFEQYEIIIKNADHIKSSTEFEQAINNALNSMKPFKALHDVFDEYGHVFPQKIILGRSFIRNITKTYDIPNRIDLKSGTLESHLDKLNLSYLLTRSGNIIEKHELLDLVQNLNDDLEIIELDNIISLYEILDKEQQEKIDNIIAKYKQDNHRIIMSGITDLKDLDNNNTDHYKRINIQPSLEDENYEVIGSIISKQKNSKLKEFLLKFGLYDFNGFSAMIKTLKKTHIKIEECYILWMIIGIPSKLSVLSPRNQDLQVKYESVTLQPNQIKMKTPISLSQKYIISVNAHHSYEPINIRLVEWSESCISFQINGTTCNNSNIYLNIENIDDYNSFIMSDNDSDTQQETENNSSTNIETVVNNIECNICILRSDYKTFRIDNGDEEYPIDLIGYKLSEENFNENLTFSDE